MHAVSGREADHSARYRVAYHAGNPSWRAVTGTPCETGSCPCATGTCFLSSVIAGDSLIAGGWTVTVRRVISDVALTVEPEFYADVIGSSWNYTMCFAGPQNDARATSGNADAAGTRQASGLIWGLSDPGNTNTYFESTPPVPEGVDQYHRGLWGMTLDVSPHGYVMVPAGGWR